MKTKLVIAAFSLLCFISCERKSNEDPIKNKLDSILAEKEYHRATEFFVIPDYINTSLLAATFYEHHDPQGHALIVYNDTTRKTATKIKYLADGTLQTEKLVVTKFNEFISEINKSEYIIKETTVLYSFTSSNSGATFEYNRTDINR